MIKVGVVACEIMRGELEEVIKDDPHVVVRKYLEFGNHSFPDMLQQEVVKTIEEIKDSCDVVLVGFGRCRGLENLPQLVDAPILMVGNEDCISILLTEDRYHKELKKEAGTYFMTPGWCEQGVVGIKKTLHVEEVAKEREMDSDHLLRMIFRGYTRVLYIDTGIKKDNGLDYEKNAKEMAEKLKVKFEKTSGSLDIIEDLFSRTNSDI
jgi:hypothetical protein